MDFDAALRSFETAVVDFYKPPLPKFKLGPLSVAKQGFGCMGMSAFYSSAKTTTEEGAKAVIREAVDAGVTLFNSADFYGTLNQDGFGHNLRCCSARYFVLLLDFILSVLVLHTG